MKAKWEGAFAVVLAVTLIFSIQYYYFSACSWYEQQEQVAGDIITTAVAIPVSHTSSEPDQLRYEAQKNRHLQQTDRNYKACGCPR